LIVAKRKGLGLPKSTHSRNAKGVINSIASGVRGLRVALDNNRCAEALHVLVSTASEWGRFNTEKRSAGEIPGEGRDKHHQDVEQAYFEQKDRFKSMCLLYRKPDDRP
jgi:hypothetical protein